jgi:hypothetical protein
MYCHHSQGPRMSQEKTIRKQAANQKIFTAVRASYTRKEFLMFSKLGRSLND